MAEDLTAFSNGTSGEFLPRMPVVPSDEQAACRIRTLGQRSSPFSAQLGAIQILADVVEKLGFRCTARACRELPR